MNAGHHRYVATDRRVREDRRFVAGKGQFVADVDLPNMKHVAVLTCPHAAAHIKSIAEYEKLCRHAKDDPDGFWSEQAESLHWFKRWRTCIAAVQLKSFCIQRYFHDNLCGSRRPPKVAASRSNSQARSGLASKKHPNHVCKYSRHAALTLSLSSSDRR